MKPLAFDIIMLALPRWDGPYSSTAYSLAKELSRFTRVFYIDNPFTYKDYLTQKNSPSIQRRKNALLKGDDIFVTPDSSHPQLTAVTPRLTIPINWLPRGFLYDRLSHMNDKVLHKAIEQTILTYGIKRYVFINSFNPLFARSFPLRLKPHLSIYHCVDDIRNSTYIAKHGEYLEAEAVAQADFTVVTSSELKRLKLQQSPHIFFLPNAADTVLFQRAAYEDLPIPTELLEIHGKKKIICYTGNICHRLDYELLLKIANHHSDKVLLMIGPLSNDSYKKVGLDTLPNVIFTGKRSIHQLPAYLKYCHCCIIPFRLNSLTRSIYPLKINEYLSAGKPVITTNFSEDIANFEHVASVTNSHDEFLTAIEREIVSDHEEAIKRRVHNASSNSWISRAEELIKIIQTHM